MRLPSTRSLETMLVVVRHGSLAAAAGELGMSVPALSRRIALLEAELGTRLFERVPRGLVLTDAGAIFHADVMPALDRLRAATAGVRRTDRNVVRLTTIPAFATRWLLPRLPHFASIHPGIEVDVRTSLAFEDLDACDTDFAVRLAPDRGMPGPTFLPIHLLPIWNPDRLGRLDSPSAVAGHVLLSPDHRPEFWHEWLRAHDIDLATPRIRDVDALLLYELALTGTGVAIGIEPLATALLRSNRLCGLTEHRIRSERSFHFVTRRAPLSRAAKLFRDWMLSGAKPIASSAQWPRSCADWQSDRSRTLSRGQG